MNGRRLITGFGSRTAAFPTVETLKDMLGIDEDDDSKDGVVAAMLDATLADIENFCGRVFMLDDYTERFSPISARDPNLLLSAWPVESVESVQQDWGMEGVPNLVTLSGWRLFADIGVVRQWAACGCWCCEAAEIVVDYRGGFPPDAWPADLVDILTRLFFDRWNATGGTGLLVGGSSGGGTGEIKSATVDGMRLDYDLGGASSMRGAADIPPDLLPYAAALARYRALDRALWGV